MTDVSVPKASVIIATYNWSSVLPYSIASALEQTETDLEVLVVGDACTDDSEQVVRSINDSRVTWFNLSERFGHQAGPNNEGHRRAAGEFIFYLGHDDLWFPHHVESFLELFDRGADMVYGFCARVAANGTLRPSPRWLTPFRRGMAVPPAGLAIRRRVLTEVGGWRDYRQIPVSPESDLVARTFEMGAKVEYCRRVTAIKFPALVRPNVYRTKTNEEQREWLNRIRTEPQLEVKILGDLLDVTTRGAMPQPFVVETRRLLKRLGRGIRSRLDSRDTSRSRIDASKKLKGSDP